KYFAMTGWRLGWMLLPQRLARAVDCLAGNFTICAPALSQHAGLAAFSAESRTELDGHVARYRANRALLLDGLAQLGLTGIAPVDGAFYAYVDVSRYTADSLEFCERLLADTGVAIAPGIDFDPVGGRTRVRFSFAGAGSQISEALDRMGRWLPAEHAGPDFSRGRP
ncbi:MAG: aminotransferase class I/II-fold pyridoxal phosphate-dependent enzyme, partial [Sciscionella sp.]